MSDELIPLLKVHQYFHGVSDEVLQEVVQMASVSRHPAGSVVHEANAALTTVGFVLSGRLKAVRVDNRGAESLFRMIERGEQFGMMVGALAEPVPIRIFALEPTTVLGVEFEQAIELTTRHPELRRLWLTTFAGGLRKHFFGAPPGRAPTVLALIHHSPATHGVAQRLAHRLCELGEKLAVFSDSDEWRGLPELRRRRLCVNGQLLDPEEIRRQTSEWQDANRIIFEVGSDLAADAARRLMEIVDRAVYLVPASATHDAVGRLQALGVPERGWRDKVSVAQLMEGGNPIVPTAPGLHEVAGRDFKIADTAMGSPWGRSAHAGLERLVHQLRGIRIGVALGGGAARGMAHLGVLKALEENGIVPDLIAGTSAGAMTGIVYASGLDPDYSSEQFSADLRPGWIFRRLRHGNAWYLLYKYRTGQFDPMLRRYIHDWKIEQLPVPCLSVAVDLVSGNYVVRERGDAVHAICESINLPGLSVPICRNGQALVDGGLVNNIPADVLVSRGCNFVIAVSVTAQIERKFCEITADGPMPRKSRPGFVSTLLRSLMVQNHCMNAIGVQAADIMVEPDVTAFDPTEFVKTKELAAVGEAAVVRQIPKIRQLLSRLDPQLFPQSGN